MSCRWSPPAACRLGWRSLLLVLPAVWLAAGTARAAGPTLQIPSAEEFEQTGAGAGSANAPFGFLSGLQRSSLLLGDMGGLRTLLSRYGVSFAMEETAEVLGNVTGGAQRGAAYDGLLQMALQVDTNRAVGWYGGTFNASALITQGTNLSANNLLTLQTASGIEADRSIRLWELWYQQKFLEEDRLDVKVGQQSLDQEFMVTSNGLYFVNTMFGWPMLPSANLPGGGPAYPLSALGVRVRYRPIDSITILGGVFNGSPVRYNYGDPQQRNPSGTSFPLNGGVLAIGEVQYAYPSLGSMVNPGESEPLARVYRLGAWYNSENFADEAYDNTGLSLANPASNGDPLSHHGNWGIYAVADQMVWMDQRENEHNLNVFVRAMGSPQGDRNLISVSLNAGIVLHEPIRHRDDDTFAIGMGYTRVTNSVSVLDQATNNYTPGSTIVRGGETFVEMTYQYQVTPWLQVQPDIQYVWNPGAGVVNPNNPPQRVGNELVLGLRTNILF
jgi:porin